MRVALITGGIALVGYAAKLEKLLKLAKAGVDRVRARRSSEMMIQIAVELGAGDLEAGEQKIHTMLEQYPWAGELVARAYRDLMDAICDQASVPLAALVSEYLVKTAAPDRRYRRVGAFIADATQDDLQTARTLTARIIEVAEAEPERSPIIVGVNEKNLGVLTWVSWYTPQPEDTHEIVNRADQYPGHPEVVDVLQMLLRHGFATPGRGSSLRTGNDDDSWEADGRIEVLRGEHLDSIRLLARCLSVKPACESAATNDESG
jgi:hypothetical protein